MNQDDISTYLPKYLSPASFNDLKKEIAQFVAGGLNQTFYASNFRQPSNLYQGDGVKEVPFITVPNYAPKIIFAMVISNSCDCDPINSRLQTMSVVYCPIISLEKYIQILQQESIAEDRLVVHLQDLRNQRITNLFYLPAAPNLEESIVFLDRMCNFDPGKLSLQDMLDKRTFSLSNFGFYLLLFKISIHFSRFNEDVDRC